MRPEYFGERMEAHRLAVKKLAQGGYSLRGQYPLGDLMISVYAAPAPAAAEPAPRLAASKPS
jgi:hypothetical protein